jgi:thiamine kinase-like enzyme
VDVEALIDRVWPGEGARVEPLGGGITNHNFKVDVAGESYVLRVGGKDTELLGIDRAHEHAATRVAAELGIGPDVVAFVEGCLVTRFVEGDPAERVDATVAGALLRRLHAAPPIPSRFDSFRVVEAYRARAEERGVPIPAAYEAAAARAAEIESRRAEAAQCTCHNDLLAANFIDDGDRLWLVDWEYAGMGDPFFDLGNFAANQELDANGERALLAAYGADDLGALHDMRFMSDFREAMWGVVQQGISELDFDFAGYAERHFERALA